MELLGKGVQRNNDEPNEEQRALLPSSGDSNRCSSLGFEDDIFSEETMQSLRELGAALQSIHNRLLSEGYVMIDGRLTKPYEQTTIRRK